MTYKFETLQLHAGQEEPDSATGARAVPIYLTSSYVFKDSEQAAGRFNLSDPGNIYGRLTNPTQEVLEKRIAALEGGVGALAVASGLAAITYAILTLATSGAEIVSTKNIYGGTFNLFSNTLTEYGIKTRFVETNDFHAIERAINEKTRALYTETLGNPNSDVSDIEKLAEIAHRHNIPLVVDSTFTPPSVFRPIEHGADIVVHSATKFIGGHGTALGGLIIDSGNFDWTSSDKYPTITKPNPAYHGVVFSEVAGRAAYIVKARAIFLRNTGATLSPFNAFILLLGLETLSLRVERHISNALKVVEFLFNHPKVTRVNHPAVTSITDQSVLYHKYYPNGAVSIFTFEIDGGVLEARRVIDHLKLFSLLANVGDAKSLAIHPASTTHSQLSPEELQEHGIKPNTIRLSIGLENIDDIIEDLKNALDTI